MAIIKPTIKSALAGINKAIKDLRTVQANATEEAAAADSKIEIAKGIYEEVKVSQTQVKSVAQADARYAAAVADKLEQLVSPDSTVEGA